MNLKNSDMTENNPFDVDLVLISKYLNHEANTEEITVVDEWINASDDHKSEMEKLKKAWELATAGIGIQEWDTPKSKEQFLLKVIQTQSNAIKDKETALHTSKILMRRMMRYAALAILLIGISSVLVYHYTSNQDGTVFTQMAVAKGSKSQMTLPDGSKVWINADSRIKYANNFNQDERSIYLEGEAYFEVAKNPHKAFKVHAGGLVVQALGTVFNVKAYPDEKVIETTLVEGSVSVELNNKPGQRTILKPNEQVFYYKPDIATNQNGNILITKGIETENSTSWINDQLIISGETLESLAVKLGRKYDVNFHFTDTALSKLRFTGVLKNETIEQILEVLKLSSPVNYRIQERDIWLMKKQD